MKTFKKTLAVVLSALMLFTMCGAAFAYDGFTQIPTADSDALADGDYWFDVEGFIAQAMTLGMPENQGDFYRNATYYISDDANTLRVDMMSGGSMDAERNDEQMAWYFDYLMQHGQTAGAFTVLPTEDSDELEYGDYWFDLAGYLAYCEENDFPPEAMDMYAGCTYLINGDGTVMRLMNGSELIDEVENDGFEPYFVFLMQHGIDPWEGFTEIPTAPDGLEPGAYWFDLESYLTDGEVDEEEREFYEEMLFYVNADGTVLRYSLNGLYFDVTENNDEDGMLAYLKQVENTVCPHNAVSVFDAVAPTCTEEGNWTYYKCDDCGLFFSDEECENEIEEGSWVREIDPENHVDFTYIDNSWYAQPGDWWIDKYQLKNDTGNSVYNDWSTMYYMCNCGNALKIVYSQSGETVTEIHVRGEEGQDVYFQNLHVLPELVDIPTSEAGLEDGAYWFDVEGFISSNYSSPEAEADAEFYRNATWKLGLSENDMSVLRAYGWMEDDSYTSGGYYSTRDYFPHYTWAWMYLQQAGMHEHNYTYIDSSTDWCETGEYWYDADGLAKALDDNAYKYASYYLCVSRDAVKIIVYVDGESVTETHVFAEEPFYEQFLKPVPAFGEPLPTSEDGLEDGDQWFDLAGFVDLLGRSYNEENRASMLEGTGCLSEDGTILRFTWLYHDVYEGQPVAYDRHIDSRAGDQGWNFLRTVGVDPMAGFNEIPTADSDDLEDGDYYFDLDAYFTATEASDEVIAMYSAYKFYLNDDADTLRIDYGGGFEEFDSESFYFYFVKQHGIEPENPFEGWIQLAFSEEELPYGGWYFDLDAYADAAVESENADLIAHGEDPMNEEDEAAYREGLRNEITSITLYFDPETESMGMFYVAYGVSETFTMDDQWYAQNLRPFIKSYDPWLPVFLDTTGLAAGDYWLDVIDLLGEDVDEEEIAAFMDYYAISALPELAAIKLHVTPPETSPMDPFDVIYTPDGEYAEDYESWIQYIYLTFADSKESTCTEAGYEDAVAITKDGETVILVEGTPRELAPHTPGEAVKENDVPSTCTEYGSYDMVTYCTVCEQPIGSEHFNYTELAPHTPGEAVKENDVPSTCTALGSYDMVVRCTKCNGILESEHFDYTELAAHTPGEAVKENDVPSTCTALGSYDMVVRCTKCNGILESEHFNYTELAAHTPGEAAKENDVPSTCTALGSYDMVVCCTKCNGILESEHFDYTELAPHAYGDWVTVTAATCHATGLAERTCACGDKEEKELAIDLNNHDGATEVRNASPATCTEAGYSGDTYCLGCGNKIASGSAINATGHTWGEWVVTKPATGAENGEETRECSVCHVTETRTVYSDNIRVCKWCGRVHNGFMGGVIHMIHNILYFFTNLFNGLKKG